MYIPIEESESEAQVMETTTVPLQSDLKAAIGPALRVLESCKLETQSYAGVSQVDAIFHSIVYQQAQHCHSLVDRLTFQARNTITFQ